VNIVCSLLLFNLMRPSGYGHVGIAIATAVSAWVNVLLLWRGLHGFVRVPSEDWKKFARMLLASVAMGAVVWVASKLLIPWLDGETWQKNSALVLIVGTGMTVYAILVIVLRATSVTEIKASFGKK
jgi:putative peptidoglycan lipid II flippase